MRGPSNVFKHGSTNNLFLFSLKAELMKKSYPLILVFLFSVTLNAQIEHLYDFNDLSLGDLDGQDDWQTILHTSGTADLFVDVVSGTVVAPDESNAVFYNASGAGFGRTATRKASANFDFDFTVGGIIEIEVEMHKNYWGMFFGAGYDADGDGHIAPGLVSEEFDGGFYINIANANPDNNKIVLPNDEVVIFTAENDGWASYKIVLDFTANDGEGAVALFYKPGATGEEWKIHGSDGGSRNWRNNNGREEGGAHPCHQKHTRRK